MTGQMDPNPIVTPQDTPSGNGGFNFEDFMKQWMTNGNGGSSGFIPSMLQAMQQYNNAGKYTDLGREAAGVANPFGDRSFYRDRLRQSYDDPSTILNDPGHQMQIKRGLDSVASNNAMKGYLGSGNMAIDLSKFASDSDATYLDAERKQLGHLAGADFDPANAGRFIMDGGKLSVESQNKALDALFTQFNNKNSPQNQDPKKISTNDIARTINGLTDPISIARALGQFGGSATDLVMRLLTSGNNISASTRSILETMTKDPQYAGLFTTGGGMDGKPISIFNDDGTINSTFPGYTEGGGGGNPDDFWEITGGENPYGSNPDGPTDFTYDIDWSNPDSIDWGEVDFNNFTPDDWTNLANWFGDGAA
jgi:hypothetical protein